MELGEVIDVEINPKASMYDLIEIYDKIHGFTPAYLVEASKILAEMVQDKDSTNFLSFTANIVATGVRGLLAQLIREGYFDVVVTTCGAIDHDIARAFGGKYYKGFFESDDNMLVKRGIHRLGNIFIPIDNYGPLIEKIVYMVLEEITSRKSEWAVYELLWEFGKRINDKHSILTVSYTHLTLPTN